MPEALTGGRAGRVLSRESFEAPGAHAVPRAEGNTNHPAMARGGGPGVVLDPEHVRKHLAREAGDPVSAPGRMRPWGRGGKSKDASHRRTGTGSHTAPMYLRSCRTRTVANGAGAMASPKRARKGKPWRQPRVSLRPPRQMRTNRGGGGGKGAGQGESGSSQQCRKSHGVRVPCRQLPDSDGKHVRCTRRQRIVFCSDVKVTAALRGCTRSRWERPGWRANPRA